MKKILLVLMSVVFTINSFSALAVDTMSGKTAVVPMAVNSYTPFAATVYNTHYYEAYDISMSWQSAKAYCESIGGHLATITSKSENNAVARVVQNGTFGGYYLGATDADKEGVWKWITNEKFSYTNWCHDQPDNCGGNENYLEMWLPNVWNDINETGKFGDSVCGFVCEYDSIKPTCKVSYGTHTYSVYDYSLNWEDAQAFCKASGGYLATITSAKEQEAVYSAVKKSKFDRYYLGGNDSRIDGNWEWVSGEKFAYTNWDIGEPNNYGGPQNYMMFIKLSGRWDDDVSAYNYSYHGFICETEPTKNNTITVSNATKAVSTKAQSFSLNAKVNGGAKLTYSSNNKNVKVDGNGKVTVSANFCGSATITIKSAATTTYKIATKKVTVTLNPTKPTLSKVSSPKKKWLKATWKKVKSISGYQIQVSDTSSFKSKNTKTFSAKASKTSWTLSGMTSKKKFFVRIRTYKTVSGKNYYSAWSGAKSLKIK